MKYDRIYQPEDKMLAKRCWCYKCRTRINLVSSCVRPESNLCGVCYLKQNMNIDRKRAVKDQLDFYHEKPLSILRAREKYHEALRQRWQYKFKQWIKKLVRKIKRWILK